MANQRWAILAVGLSVFIVAGCQSNKPMSKAVPPPTFSGPKIETLSAAPKSSGPVASMSGPSAWVPKVPPRPWKYIVIHHSASPTGSMAAFDREHKAKGWDGVGYHFVIGNGTGTGDGQVEVTPRWPIQKWGAHAKTIDNRYNDYGIGICLVGNFDMTNPTSSQMKSLTRLVSYLMMTYNIPAQNVVGHRDTKATDCPGKYVNVATIRQSAARAVAEAGGRVSPDQSPANQAQTARAELLHAAR